MLFHEHQSIGTYTETAIADLRDLVGCELKRTIPVVNNNKVIAGCLILIEMDFAHRKSFEPENEIFIKTITSLPRSRCIHRLLSRHCYASTLEVVRCQEDYQSSCVADYAIAGMQLLL